MDMIVKTDSFVSFLNKEVLYDKTAKAEIIR